MQIRSSWLWGDIHVDGEALCLCLFQEASADFVPVEDEWNERRRTQMTAIGFKGASLMSTTSKECRDSDADLDVDGDDTLEYGRAQYTETDVIPCSGESSKESAANSSVLPDSRPKLDFPKWPNDGQLHHVGKI
ncbi:hypothetical protein XENOCAPTIV_002274 [Xenoophorus captivus]|uniref:E3 ubiquitin-protein ligase RNF220 middle domain-containing protein n=1 Tax=Xenoophorus captivus TaxID=1517983 RepID=A0ABV0RVD4_9TELE